MSIRHIVFKNIIGSPVRSSLVLFCLVLISASAIWAIVALQNTQENVAENLSTLDRFEPGIIVIPRASGSPNTRQVFVELERLYQSTLAIPGVQSVSPQLQLYRIESGDSYTVVAFDPERDVSVLPRLNRPLDTALNATQAISGNDITIPSGETLNLDGYEISVVAHLKTTGTSLDRSVFVTFETALNLAQSMKDHPNLIAQHQILNIPSLLVNFQPGYDPQVVINQILKDIPGVTVFDSSAFFQSNREQVSRLQNGLPKLLAMIWGLSVVCMGAIFLISANERRREVAILRALGSPRAFVIQLVVSEGLLLATGGSLIGISLSMFLIALFSGDMAYHLSGGQFSLSGLFLFRLALISFATAVTSVLLASAYPAWKASRHDPSFQMKG